MPAETNHYTYFTTAGATKRMLSTDQQFKEITLLLETAGPVAVGQQEELQPIASGKGRFLVQGIPYKFTMSPLSTLYVASNTVNRIGVTVAPFPYLEAILMALNGIGGGSATAAPVAISNVPIGGFGFKGKLPGSK